MRLDKINRILLIRTDRFGEFILNIPVINAIRMKFPSAYICIMVGPMVKELMEGNSMVNEILVYDEKAMRGFIKNFKLIREIRKRKFDLTVILNPKKKFNILTFLSGIPFRLGYNRKWGFLLTQRVEDRKFSGEKHEAEYNLDLVRSLGIEVKDKSLIIPLFKEDGEAVDFLLKSQGITDADSLIALHPWTSDPIKQWPLERFSELAERLSGEFLGKIIIIGGREESELSKGFCQSKRYLINLTSRLTLRQLAAFFKKCRLLISNDSGPVHLASAVNTPVLVIFRSGLPGKSSKRWGPWGERNSIIENESLEKISVDEVLTKVKTMLND